MTGREFIIYILENHLEDKEIFDMGRIAGLKTLSEVAEEYDVCDATVRTWINLNQLEAVNISCGLYVPANAVPKVDSPLIKRRL